MNYTYRKSPKIPLFVTGRNFGNLGDRSIVMKVVNMQSITQIYNQGIELSKIGQYQLAFDCFDRVVKSDPHDVDGWINRGVVLAAMRNDLESLLSFDRAVELNPNDAVTWGNRGCILRGLARYDEAIASFDRALQINPDYQLAIENRQELLEDISHR
jgi:tetratricopeptide (TPR) repeat protein